MIHFIEDRKEPTYKQIVAKQDFEALLNAFQKEKSNIKQKNSKFIFFGAVGFASIIGLILIIT